MRVHIQAGGAAGLVFILLCASSLAASPVHDPLKDLSIEELSNIEVISASKREERLSDAPTSVFVITSEDIRRSGVTSLPEALRLAPNLQVARVSANEYAISARGFNGTAANKLLVSPTSIYPSPDRISWEAATASSPTSRRAPTSSAPCS
jgi:iron complex outermembrane recepter protein